MEVWSVFQGVLHALLYVSMLTILIDAKSDEMTEQYYKNTKASEMAETDDFYDKLPFTLEDHQTNP